MPTVELLQRNLQAADRLIAVAREAVAAGHLVGVTERDRISRLYWQAAIEHGTAIASLVRQRLGTSSRALVRPQLESVVRGAWARWIAGEGKIETLAAGEGHPPKLAETILLLRDERFGVNLNGQTVPFPEFYEFFSPAMHDGTHVGMWSIALLAGTNIDDEIVATDDEFVTLYFGAVLTGAACLFLLESLDEHAEAARCSAEFVVLLRALLHQNPA